MKDALKSAIAPSTSDGFRLGGARAHDPRASSTSKRDCRRPGDCPCVCSLSCSSLCRFAPLLSAPTTTPWNPPTTRSATASATRTSGSTTLSRCAASAPSTPATSGWTGLYFDRQTDPSRLLVPTSTMRVGISAQGYVLPAPTGIVDYELTRAGDQLRDQSRRGLRAVRRPLRGASSSSCRSCRAASALRAASRVSRMRTRAAATSSGCAVRRRAALASHRVDRDHPVLQSRDPGQRSRAARSSFRVRTCRRRSSATTSTGRAGPTTRASARTTASSRTSSSPQDWAVNAGIFRSQFDARSQLRRSVPQHDAPTGSPIMLMIADRESEFASTSGELRVSRRFVEGERHHALYYSLRARDQQRRYGGSDVHDLGVARIGERVPTPEPEFEFGPQTRDEVKQSTHALAYRGRWSELVELTLGLQKTRYEKAGDRRRVQRPAARRGRSVALQRGLALYASEQLAWYASYSHRPRGRRRCAGECREQECRAAGDPYEAVGRGSSLRVHTVAESRRRRVRHREAVLQSRRCEPVYRELGEQRHRGIEFSIAGQLVEGLNVVVGTMLLEPRVTGEEVDERAHRRGSGRADRTPHHRECRLSPARGCRPSRSMRRSPASTIAWRAVTISSRFPRAASSTWVHAIDSRSAGRPRRCVFQVGNVFDTFGWRTNPSEVFVINAPRRFSITIAADFLGSKPPDRSGP